MKRFIITALALLLSLQLSAQLKESEALFYLSRLHNLLDDREADTKVEYYAFKDFDNDGYTELVLADYNLKGAKVYSCKNARAYLDPLPITDAIKKRLNKDSLYIVPVRYMYSDFYYPLENNEVFKSTEPYTDMPLIMVYDADIAKNRFSTDFTEEKIDAASFAKFNKMIFKPHIGDVKFAGIAPSKKEYYKWSVVFNLVNPEFTKTQFRGYKNYEVAPIIVEERFLESHTPLNFLRWKAPEPVKAIPEAAKKAIVDYFNGRKILNGRYLANCDAKGMVWYEVILENKNSVGLNAVVCLSDGKVRSVAARYEDELYSSNDVWFGGNVQDYWFGYSHEIMCIFDTPQGVEMLVRWNSREGIHYSIFREIGAKWVIVIEDYQYTGAY
ncbi:MAG: hypothetical protein IKI67_04895 [Bacteroidales bacterium]|nr:hypothetical protein [Bacteroidales bacterium]